jgi:ribosome-associated protein
MPDDLPITDHLIIPGDELTLTAARASGPGGQHVNKTSSKVILSWDLANSRAVDDVVRNKLLDRLSSRITRDGILPIHVDSERSQHRNRELARARLVALINDALHEDPKRRPTRIPRSQKKRRLENKRRRSETKKARQKPVRGD